MTPSRAALAGVSVACVGALVLLGWIFDIDGLKSVYGPITMKTNTAIGLLLCGTALWSYTVGRRRLGIGCAAGAAALGALTLSQHLFGWDLGIDQLLFREPAGAAATASPNRMGPNAATTFALTGTAILLLFRNTPTSITVAQRLAIVCMILEILALAGYVYGAVALYAVARYTGIALHTAAALLVLSLGVLSARLDMGPMAVFTADGAAGMLLRRLVLPVFGVPLALGYVVIRGREADLYDRGLAMALFAVSTVVLLGAIVWLTAQRIARSEEQRRRAERDRDLLLVSERRARDEAERASRLKDQFIAVLSHELRTPLNVMLGWTRVLESGETADRHMHAAAVVARNGRLLARLVEDLLDISRAAAGQFEITRRPMAMNAVVQAALDAMMPIAAQKEVSLEGDLDPAVGTIEGDAERVQQIVSNLLTNAVKFTGAGGRVHVRTAADANAITLTVSDTGIGFDETFAAQLFQPFRQADSSARREHGGLGLGLSIAKHIAELHGGSIRGSSAGRGQGATFTVTLPVNAADRAARVPPARESSSPTEGSADRNAPRRGAAAGSAL